MRRRQHLPSSDVEAPLTGPGESSDMLGCVGPVQSLPSRVRLHCGAGTGRTLQVCTLHIRTCIHCGYLPNPDRTWTGAPLTYPRPNVRGTERVPVRVTRSRLFASLVLGETTAEHANGGRRVVVINGNTILFTLSMAMEHSQLQLRVGTWHVHTDLSDFLIQTSRSLKSPDGMLLLLFIMQRSQSSSWRSLIDH